MSVSNNHKWRSGFTLTELIVVMALGAIFISIALPGMSAMRRSTQTKVASNTISAAATAIRAFAIQQQPDLGITNLNFPGATYSGVAMIFTPGGEMRLVEEIQDAMFTGLISLASQGYNGYTDIPRRDYVRLPSDVGVVGISRNAGGANPPLLLTPPFAIRFNEHGNLIAGQGDDRAVIYDSNYNNLYNFPSTRPNTYNPDQWDPHQTSNVANENNNINDPGRFNLPFERIETAIGVMVYSKQALRDAGRNHNGAGGGINSAARNWILDPANEHPVLIFSRYSGTTMKR